MFTLKFEINGKEVAPDQVGNELERALLEELRHEVDAMAGAVWCPVHKSRPTVLAKGQSLDYLNFEVSGCCDAVIAEVQANFEGEGGVPLKRSN